MAKIILENRQEILEKIDNHGLYFLGTIDVRVQGLSLTNGEREEFIGGFMDGLLTCVPKILENSSFSKGFLASPPDEFVYLANNDECSINVLKYGGESVNPKINRNGLKASREQLVNQIMENAYLLDSCIKELGIDAENKNYESFKNSLTKAESAIESHEETN